MKWAGGKTQMLDALVARSPARVATYFEPFLGGGALFFALLDAPDRFSREEPRRAVLNDLCPDLMVAFRAVRDDPDGLAERLGALERRYLPADGDRRADLYYAVRAEAPEEPVEVAARLMFLNKTCYNGLYRVNRQGHFNVPHGRYKNPRILDRDALLAASRALDGAELLCVDFEQACEEARRGDFVYLDPPFHPLSATSSFTAYTETDFGREDQLRLKWCIDDLTERGVRVMLSNSPHPWIMGMYETSRYRLEEPAGEGSSRWKPFQVEELPARRAINSRGDRRRGSELVITNYDLPGSSAK